MPFTPKIESEISVFLYLNEIKIFEQSVVLHFKTFTFKNGNNLRPKTLKLKKTILLKVLLGLNF